MGLFCLVSSIGCWLAGEAVGELVFMGSLCTIIAFVASFAAHVHVSHLRAPTSGGRNGATRLDC
jgi:hypothetical protein